jgi:hypothetical protein
MEERQVEYRKDVENTEENCEMIGKIWKKSRLNSEKIWKIQTKLWKMRKKSRLNCEMI